MINIPKNEYVQPTEVREEVVQAICDSFLGDLWNVYHPVPGPRNRGGRNQTRHVVKPNRRGVANVFSFWHEQREPEPTDTVYRFNGAEMKQAFKELINAGYYMFKVYSYGEWFGYKCSKVPFMEGGTMVTSFDYRID